MFIYKSSYDKLYKMMIVYLFIYLFFIFKDHPPSCEILEGFFEGHPPS